MTAAPAFLRVVSPSPGGPDGPPEFRLELHDPARSRGIEFEGRRYPMASDLTTPLVYHFARSPLPLLQEVGLLDPQWLEKVAGLYQGIRVGNAEMRGLSMQTPQGPIKLATIRFNFEGGKIGELAFEGLDARAPKGPVKLERFALKSLDISGLMHMAAQFAGQKPSPDQALLIHVSPAGTSE